MLFTDAHLEHLPQSLLPAVNCHITLLIEDCNDAEVTLGGAVFKTARS
jgi:hypothetical protein